MSENKKLEKIKGLIAVLGNNRSFFDRLVTIFLGKAKYRASDVCRNYSKHHYRHTAAGHAVSGDRGILKGERGIFKKLEQLIKKSDRKKIHLTRKDLVRCYNCPDLQCEIRELCVDADKDGRS